MIGRSPARRISRPYERGSAVIMVVIWVALAIGATGAISYFEALATLKRMEAQTRAESLALGAAVSTRAYGPENRCEEEYGGAFLNRLHELNGGDGAPPCPTLETRQVGDLTTALGVDATQNADVKAQLWRFNVDSTVERSGRALRVFELVGTDEDFERELGNIELLLDFSRSMEENNKIGSLKNAIDSFVGVIENVQVGAVLFATNILLDIPLAEAVDAQTQVLANQVQGRDVGRQDLGSTNYALGISTAVQRLNAQPVGGKTIIFISDGKPTVPQPEDVAIQQAIAAGDAAHGQDIDLLGLFVGEDNEAATMRRIIDGPPPGLQPPEDINNNFLVNPNAGQIQEFFESLVIEFVCRVPIADALEADFPDAETSVWMRTNAPEPGIPIERVDDINDMFGDYEDPVTGERRSRAEELKYAILQSPPAAGDELSLYVSKAVCQFLETEGNDVVFRAGFARSAALDGVL